ncbi:MAG: hypothetical protein J1G02_06160 [Clostridiales bacterium]|nr:hypothetical protein [Clostridiales bacterium]
MNEKDIEIISEMYKDEKEPFYEKIHERIEAMYESTNKKKKAKKVKASSIRKRKDNNC